MAGTQLLRVRDFAGGMNMNDSQVELAHNELADCNNITLDEHGAASARLGFDLWNGTAYDANKVINTFYSQTLGKLIAQSGTKLYADGTLIATMASTARCGFADFAGKLCVIHPTGGLFTYDGATFSAAIAGAPSGSTLAVWQNKLWAAGNSTNLSRVQWSAAGDPTSWPSASFVDLREVDDAQVVRLEVEGGLDVTGRAGLLAFKRRSGYRIYDSTSGAYQTIDNEIGACSSLAVTSTEGRTIVLGERGVFQTDSHGRLREASGKMRQLFDPAILDYSQLDLVAAGSFNGRSYFSLPKLGATANNVMLEYDSRHGWMTLNDNAVSCYTVYGLSTKRLLGGSPTVNGRVYKQLQNQGIDKTDTGVSAQISAFFRTAWFVPNDGMNARLLRLRVLGLGAFSVYPLLDYETTLGAGRSVSIAASGTNAAGRQDLLTLGAARAVGFYIAQTASATVAEPGWNVGSARRAEWTVYGLDLSYVPLGRV